MDTKKAASFRNISVLKKLSSKFSFPPCFRKSIFGIRKKKSCLIQKYFCLKKIIIKILISAMFPKKYFRNTKKEKLPRPFETASLLAPYLCLLYELLHVYFYLFRELRADGTFYVFTSFRFIPFFQVCQAFSS